MNLLPLCPLCLLPHYRCTAAAQNSISLLISLLPPHLTPSSSLSHRRGHQSQGRGACVRPFRGQGSHDIIQVHITHYILYTAHYTLHLISCAHLNRPHLVLSTFIYFHLITCPHHILPALIYHYSYFSHFLTSLYYNPSHHSLRVSVYWATIRFLTHPS